MAVIPVNIARISQNLQSFSLLRTIQSSHLGLFRSQNQLATGLRFQVPSEDPARAAVAGKLDRRLDTLGLVQENLQTVNAAMSEGESAMQEAVDLMREAYAMSIESVNDTNSADERDALGDVTESIIDRLVSVANRKYLDTYLFSGHYGDGPPFERTPDGVVFRGDNGRLFTIVDSDLSQDSFTISGREFFNAFSSAVRGVIDLNPSVTSETRISDLRGATDTGVALGRIAVMSGAQQTEIDLSGAATLGDVIDRLNAEMPADLTAALTSTGIQITSSTPPGDIQVMDVANGRTAVELGLATPTRVSSILGQDLDPRLTQHTALSSLNLSAGVDLSAGITIRNGATIASISFAGAQTVEDVLNRINESEAGVVAKISDDGSHIDVLNRVSGSELRIEENGGLTATALGIRSQFGGTRLSELNDGRGIETVDGGDFRITTRSGTSIDIDLDTLDLNTATLQDVIDLLNTAGGGAITASLASSGNGLVITDNTLGAGTLQIQRLNLSPAIDGLGLNVTSAAGALTGGDRNPAIVDGPFTALLELQRGLENNSTQQIHMAGERLKRTLEGMQGVQGRLAAKARAMLDRADRVEGEITSTQVLQSDVRDVDMAEAIVRFQQLQTALQANLATAGRLQDLSLMNYLR